MLEIYIREDCPFCQKVLAAIDEMGLVRDRDIGIVDAAPGTPGREVVERVGGKAMVPFLLDGDVAMYESDDIIEYLRATADPSHQ
jgi:glutathione S-transferase